MPTNTLKTILNITLNNTSSKTHPNLNSTLNTTQSKTYNTHGNSNLLKILNNQAALNKALIDRNECAELKIERVVVALGSNFKAVDYLAAARERLEKLGLKLYWSSPFVNPDYTATQAHPKPDYTNQCGDVMLKTAQSLNQLITISKEIEKQCKQLHGAESFNNATYINTSQERQQERGRVPIDIDILAVQAVGQWHIIKQRYSFKEHELIGIKELFEA